MEVWHYKYVSLPPGPIRDFISRGCWRDMEKEERPPSRSPGSSQGLLQWVGLASSFGDQNQVAPTASPRTTLWLVSPRPGHSVSAHNGFPFGHSPPGISYREATARPTCPGQLEWIQDWAAPEISVLPSSTPAGGFLETPPAWHLGGCACHPVSHTHPFQPSLDLKSGWGLFSLSDAPSQL